MFSSSCHPLPPSSLHAPQIFLSFNPDCSAEELEEEPKEEEAMEEREEEEEEEEDEEEDLKRQKTESLHT